MDWINIGRTGVGWQRDTQQRAQKVRAWTATDSPRATSQGRGRDSDRRLMGTDSQDSLKGAAPTADKGTAPGTRPRKPAPAPFDLQAWSSCGVTHLEEERWRKAAPPLFS